MIAFGLFLLAAMIGQVGHWLKRFKKQETFISYLDYMRHNPYRSIASLSTIFIAVVGICSMGVVDITLQNMCMAVMGGYTCDSIVNEFPED